jgi:hypothetical protein
VGISGGEVAGIALITRSNFRTFDEQINKNVGQQQFNNQRAKKQKQKQNKTKKK